MWDRINRLEDRNRGGQMRLLGPLGLRFWSFLRGVFVLSTATIASAANQYHFDLGTPTSPVKPGWTRITHTTLYRPEHGYGWTRAAEGSFNDEEPVAIGHRELHPNWAGPLDDPLLRDGVEDSRPLTFLADVPPGRYQVTVTLGRYRAFRHDMAFRLNGAQVATNIDAWGYVWGSQGGTPTRTLAAIAEPEKGQLRLEFDYKQPGVDRWTEFNDRRPEGGRFWFLGDNRNSVVAIRIRPIESALIHLEQGRIVGAIQSTALRQVTTEFNTGNLEKALQLISAQTLPEAASVDEWIEEGSILDALVGSLAVTDRKTEIALLSRTTRAWNQVLLRLPTKERESSARYWLSIERLESAQRYRLALTYVGMLAYRWADEQTGLNKYHRYWAAYDLCGPFTPEDPLYFKSHLLRGRVAQWNGHEGGWKNCYNLAAQHFALLLKAFPENRIVRMYSGQQVTSSQRALPVVGNAPVWATLQREALNRYLAIIHYWIRERQASNGELGGNWGDDVEILRGWLPAVLGIGDPLAREGLRKIAQGVWTSGEMTNGFSTKVSDVEHGAEFMSDTHPLMCYVDYGNPLYLERCMATLRCMRDVWTTVTPRGHRHFRSHNFSATEVDTAGSAGVDVALNGRAVHPGIPLLWYAKHPAARQLLGEWCRSWIEDAQRTDNGKPLGFVPGSIRPSDERLGGFAESWWQTKGYFSDFESVGYTQTLYDTMVALFADSEDPFFMTAIQATAIAAQSEGLHPGNSTTAGSAVWAARVSDCEEVAGVVAKWRQLTGRRDHDAFLGRKGSAYTRYLVSGNLQPLEKELNEIISGLSSNVEMSTSEVLFTDRVNLPGNEVLFEMMTGSVGTPTYQPLHAVTWEGIGISLGVLVQGADSNSLEARLFRFPNSTGRVQFRPWRLTPGSYQWTLEKAESKPRRFVVGRGSFILKERGECQSLPVPQSQSLILKIQLLKAAPPLSSQLADLALDEDAILVQNPPLRYGKPARLKLTLHNIGLASSPAIAGKLIAQDGQKIHFVWGTVDAPLDLLPKLTTTELIWTPQKAGKQSLRVEVDPRHKVAESVRLNNSRAIPIVVLP